MKKMFFFISMLLCLFSCSKDFENGNDISDYQVKKLSIHVRLVMASMMFWVMAMM